MSPAPATVPASSRPEVATNGFEAISKATVMSPDALADEIRRVLRR